MRWPALLCLPLLLNAPARADEKDELVAKQKMTATTLLKKVGAAKPALVETADLIVGGDYPEAKLKPMAENVQKHYAAAFKALKFEMTDSPPKGKLAVYFFPDRKHFGLFVGELTNDRIDKDDRTHIDARSEQPHVAVSVRPGEKPTDLEAVAVGQVAVALLQCKAGPAMLPGWMREGFARAMTWHTEPRSAAADRSTLRKLLYETKTKPSKYKVADVWSPGVDAEKRLLAAGLMDYLVFGPGAASLPKVLGGLRQDENGRDPTFDAALKSADIMPDTLDKAWKRWVTTGK